MSETNYHVNIRYAVDSRAGRSGSNALNDDIRKLEQSNKSATASFGILGVAAAAAFAVGVRQAGTALIGFNSSVEDSKLQIAGMMALAKKTDLVDQIGNADRVFANLQKRAASLPGTTMEYVKMAGMLTQPIMDAGLGMKDLEDLTVNSVVGAKALGVEWQAAARDVDQALRGVFHSTDVFTGKILGSRGFKGEEGRAKFNAMTAEQRAAELKGALMQPQLTQLAAAQGQTFGGILSTLQDSLQQTMGKVGLPLFQAVGKEIKDWNKWLDANSVNVAHIAHDVGEGIAKGFSVMKDAVGFLVEHSDAIMAMGKIWLAVKLGGMLQGGVGGAVGRGSALLDWTRGRGIMSGPLQEGESRDMGSGMRQTMTLKSAAANAGLIAQSLGVGYALGTLLDNATGLSRKLSDMGIDKTTKRFEALELQSAALGDAMERAAAKSPLAGTAITNLQGAQANYALMAGIASDAVRMDRESTWVDAEGGVQRGGGGDRKRAALEAIGITSEDISGAGGIQAFADQMNAKAEALASRQATLTELGNMAYVEGFAELTAYQRQTLDDTKAQQDLFAEINRRGLTISAESIVAIMRAATADPEGKHKAIADKPKVTVNIARIEVQSDDPDRMAFGMIESFRDAAKNPSSAFATMREG